MPEGDVDYNGANTVFCGKEYCISGISDYVERERERKRPGSLYLQVGGVSFLPKPFKGWLLQPHGYNRHGGSRT
jgi:hypothetical protein